MLTRLFLIRHGAIDERWRGRIYGALEVPLAPGGEEEARSLAQQLELTPLAAVVSSGLSRAEFTAALLRESRGLERVDDPDLRELERGVWTGLSVEELERTQPGAWADWHRAPASRRPAGGESLSDLAGRALPALDRWALRYPGANVALVTHSWVIRIAVCRALGLELEAAPQLEVPTGRLVIVDWPIGERDAPDEAQALRPTLVAFAADEPPSATPWFRGPTRDSAARGPRS